MSGPDIWAFKIFDILLDIRSDIWPFLIFDIWPDIRLDVWTGYKAVLDITKTFPLLLFFYFFFTNIYSDSKINLFF